VAVEPVQFSATSQSPALARHSVDEGLKASAGQVAVEPVQFSATSQSPAAERQTVLDETNASVGHVELPPVQVSATSHAPAAERQTAPAFPAACLQSGCWPLQRSVVQGLPSSVQAVSFALTASAGQLGPLPVQVSARSHSSPAATGRHTVLDGRKPSAGHVVLLPAQLSATSQTPAALRQTVPALPAACWQVTLVPSQVSVVQTFPSSVHAVPLAFFASRLGQSMPVPGQVSARSQSPAAERHTVLVDLKPSAGQLAPLPGHVSA
jgi:hypothetical protein